MPDAANEPVAFRYPPGPLIRRHGPGGYSNYRSYRPWLRDEFTFRCAYCLIRERWGRVTGEFDLDHFVPLSVSPRVVSDYDDLLYACHTCNLRKAGRVVPDPSVVLTSETVRIYPDGTIVGTTHEAERLIRVLCLNSRGMVRWRRTWMRITELAKTENEGFYRELMGFPDDLPDLATRRAPKNTRPDGIHRSFLARRRRGELEDVYFC